MKLLAARRLLRRFAPRNDNGSVIASVLGEAISGLVRRLLRRCAPPESTQDAMTLLAARRLLRRCAPPESTQDAMTLLAARRLLRRFAPSNDNGSVIASVLGEAISGLVRRLLRRFAPRNDK